MNENLKPLIGKYITVCVKLFVDNSLREEYVQGILKDIQDDVLIVEQHFPFCNLFIKDAKTEKLTRNIKIQDTIAKKINTF